MSLLTDTIQLIAALGIFSVVWHTSHSFVQTNHLEGSIPSSLSQLKVAENLYLDVSHNCYSSLTLVWTRRNLVCVYDVSYYMAYWPYVQPMLHAPCSMLHAPCSMLHAPCSMLLTVSMLLQINSLTGTLPWELGSLPALQGIDVHVSNRNLFVFEWYAYMWWCRFYGWLCCVSVCFFLC
jgi:hypothetical protein